MRRGEPAAGRVLAGRPQLGEAAPGTRAAAPLWEAAGTTFIHQHQSQFEIKPLFPGGLGLPPARNGSGLRVAEAIPGTRTLRSSACCCA